VLLNRGANLDRELVSVIVVGLGTRVLTFFSPIVSDPEDKQDESKTIASQLIQALGIIQGVALIHKPTKAFLGRKYSLEVRSPDLL